MPQIGTADSAFTISGIHWRPYLVRSKTDPKTVQALLRHTDVKTTLQLYSHSVSEDRMLAQGVVLQAILGDATDESGLRAD